MIKATHLLPLKSSLKCCQTSKLLLRRLTTVTRLTMKIGHTSDMPDTISSPTL